MMRNFWTFLLTLSFALVGVGINAKAQDNYYIFPIDAPPLLSANFGELRSNHFHAGIDIKTGGVEGAEVYAAADGYISRIGIKPSGYGRVLYIAHPNGTTTVYAHLREFTPEVEAYVKQRRYRMRQHNPDIYPPASMFPVKQGDLIAHSGNSGSSGGPHLHYEVRKSSDQSVLNPITRGHIKTTDTKLPLIVSVFWIAREDVAGVATYNPRRTPVKALAAGKYGLSAPLSVSGEGCFAVEVRDTKDNVSNKFAIYRTSVAVDGEEIFGLQIDGFPFADTKYVNDVMEYPLSTASSYDIIRLSRHDSNPLAIYNSGKGSGFFTPQAGQKVRIEVEDDCGNLSTLEFSLAVSEPRQRVVSVPTGSVPVIWDKEYKRTTGAFSVTVPKGAFYRNTFFAQYKEQVTPSTPSTSREIYSDIYTIKGSETPPHKAMTLSLACYLPDSLRTGACLARVDMESGAVTYAGGKWNNGAVTISTSAFGSYAISRDTVPPTATISFAEGADLSGKSSFNMRFEDDFSGIASYVATIDGHWIILDQKSTSSPHIHHFDRDWLNRGTEHTLEVTLTDGAGNKSIIRRKFRY